jgi:uncharacterized protein (TIGR03435 family)
MYPNRRSSCGAIFLALCSVAPLAVAQKAVPATPGQSLAFEVVSIRPSKTGNRGPFSVIAPDGYHAPGQSVWATIMMAYFPQGLPYWTKERLSGAPNWIFSSVFDIDARVSEADRAAWQKQGMNLEKEPMLCEMLRAMLADRYKLVVRRVAGQADGYALVTGKHGPRLIQSSPGATLPIGVRLADGGVAVGSERGQPLQWSFHSASMADLVDELKIFSSHPVVDRTGLGGHYNFVMRCGEFDPDLPDSCRVSGGDVVHQWDLDSLGLLLEPIKIPADTLVIDHIERPSAN